MKVSSTLLAGLVALASARKCGTKPNAAIEALHASMAADHGTNRRAKYLRPADDPFKIPTFFHVITCGDEKTPGECSGTVTDGDSTRPRSQTAVSQKVIDDQLATLNAAYAPAGFSFVLNKTDFVPAPQWRDLNLTGTTDEEMKSKLRQGDYSTLNVYVTPIGGDDVTNEQTLGYATFPGKASKIGFARDGVVIDPNTMPGVDGPPMNLGMTLVHEVGHWLGLLHTFQPPSDADPEDELAGCRGPGDYIHDTPAEASAASGCETGRDTCTGTIEAGNMWSIPGPDPIHNYMDYSDDACLNQFTPQQMERMAKFYSTLRVDYVEGTQNWPNMYAPTPKEEPQGKPAQGKRAKGKVARV